MAQCTPYMSCAWVTKLQKTVLTLHLTQPVIVALSFSTVSVAAAVIDVTIADIFGAYILRHAVLLTYMVQWQCPVHNYP